MNDFDSATYIRLQNLVDERMYGKYKSDKDGFAQALVKFTETATYDETRKLSFTNRIARPSINYNQVFESVDKELERFHKEIM